MVTKAGFTSGRSNAPRLSKRKDTATQDRRLSVCTDCRRGIFTQHEYLWTSRGMVHQECEDKRLDET